MRYICVTELYAGAIIIFISLVRYRHMLREFQIEEPEVGATAKWKSRLCVLLLVCFFIGFLLMGTYLLLTPEDIPANNLLGSTVFLCGALFVVLMNVTQHQMYSTINDQYDEIIWSLVNAVEAKDEYTRGHSEHVHCLVRLFYEQLPPDTRKAVNKARLLNAAVLHDIGKIGIPDSILNKPGALTPEEMDLMRQHPLLGKQILESTSFKQVGDIIYKHHERIDGQGYYKIPPEEAPIESRIIAIADTFSALYTDRCYRPRKSYSQALGILRDAAGTQLDAALVGCFCSIPREKIEKVTLDIYGYNGQSAA